MRAGIRLIVALLAVLMMPTFGGTADGGLNYIDKDALKNMLGAPNVLIIDVRQPDDWNSSAKKIPGAVRQDPDQVAAWGPNLPKNKQIVLYCA